jgi:hypothetical protein
MQMADARRRDEWDRWSRLLALVDTRTNFSQDAQPVRPIDLWPQSLVTATHRRLEAKARDDAKVSISMKELAGIMLKGKPHV